MAYSNSPMVSPCKKDMLCIHPLWFSRTAPTTYFGVFDKNSVGNSSNHVFGVELDTSMSAEFEDINDNHVGIDINDLKSAASAVAGYHNDDGIFNALRLASGNPMQVWVEYDGMNKHINVTLAPINIDKPKQALLSLTKDLSPILEENMYVGFSSSTGMGTASQYILGWSFEINGQSQPLELSQLPKLPRKGDNKHKGYKKVVLAVALPMISLMLVLLVTLTVNHVIKRKKFSEQLEDWEQECGPSRFRYKDLYLATKGFREKELLGRGGFGKVYKGVIVIAASKAEIAVKRVSHESKQGVREFVAEVVSIGRLRHRNLVPLRGYCRRKGELLLVYDYMPNGSLDKYLFNKPKLTLNWSQRFRIIKGVASALLYLHEGWEQVVVHRDIKASNVLLDAEMNGRLGDFGLARLHDHGSNPQTTHVAGTFGYMAPEHIRTGKATTISDVFGFGAFLLEVACGRRPTEKTEEWLDNANLADWVYDCWKKGGILEAKDQNLSTDSETEEVELVLKLGLFCSQSEPTARPSMHQVMHYLEREVPLPHLSLLSLPSTFRHHTQDLPNPASPDRLLLQTSVVESILSGGR
ncbi:L-type lectin-domain containing receptor kinase IV.1 isoform X2 [Arachis ipaensis]|uniref:L-type lectin-domain containing receptor kinase IV.1 isoform X2 n=1 Tax=Arachis ipaensis TaxID=130454 RepID=UPI0007AF48BC|nr:L-type lectin-domain containing receptor kinase IV.1 isoform X2 [Arachis ipaensis]